MTLSFGVSLSTSSAPGADPVRDVRRAEQLGFDFVTVSDHLHGAHPTFETWTVLTWAAAHTDRIGLVTNVLGLPYRNPPAVAKMAESLDRLSGGRLTLGLGAGGNNQEAEAFGLVPRSPAEKVEALSEAVEIIRRLWREETVVYTGAHFHTEGARIEPKAQRPIPIWLGVYGPRGVSLAGRLADGWTPSLPYLSLPRAVGMMKRLRSAAEAAGRSPDAIVCNYNIPIRVGGRARDDRSVAGTSDEIAGRLSQFVQAGFTSLAFWPIGDDADQLGRLAHEILPQVREAVAA
jgi:probable F420-dependent oxidoreductase